MRILVIGNSKSAEILTNFLSENKDLLVFTTKEGTDGNFIDINPKDVEELKEFALANEINLTIAADIFLSDIDYFSVFGESNLAVLAPDYDAAKIASLKSYGKKFIYKNKIKTPKFAFFEKLNLALDYIRSAEYPLVIKPDGHCETETAYIAETFGAAKKQVEKLFQNDNKKILIEEYIYGKEMSIYVLSDGFRPIVLDAFYTYRNELAVKTFLKDELKEKIYNEIIFPTISSLAEDGLEYTGILGFDIILTPDGEPYLIEYNSFFKDLDIEAVLRGVDEDWVKLFMDAIVGTLADNFETPFSISRKDEYYGAFRFEDKTENEIITQSARTLSLLKTKLLEEGLNREDLKDAERLWNL